MPFCSLYITPELLIWHSVSTSNTRMWTKSNKLKLCIWTWQELLLKDCLPEDSLPENCPSEKCPPSSSPRKILPQRIPWITWRIDPLFLPEWNLCPLSSIFFAFCEKQYCFVFLPFLLQLSNRQEVA